MRPERSAEGLAGGPPAARGEGRVAAFWAPWSP
jgi:hypothetical protein